MNFIYRHDLGKWDRRFIELAEHIAQWSKGPRKRVGAVIVREDRTVASTGYNGAPAGFDDDLFLRMDREAQHEVVVHAEDNALQHLHAAEFSGWLTLYVSPLLPCETCADLVIKDGRIKRVVAYCGHMSDDWLESACRAFDKLAKAGIEMIYVDDKEESS